MSEKQAHLNIDSMRGEFVEATHEIAACLCDASGYVQARVSTPHVTTWRSAAKPFQLEACLTMLPRDITDNLSAAEIAVGASSHSGEPHHIDTVRGLMKKLGVSEDLLRCGAHLPMHLPSQHALIAAGNTAEPIHNNCSGKHCYMLATCHTLELDPAGYLKPDHPVQQLIYNLIQLRTSRGIVDRVIDGCGVPCFVLPLQSMARAWAQLAVSHDESTTLGRIAQSMKAHPEQVSGTNRLDQLINERSNQALITKIGAAGLLCGALPERGLGFAIKVTSGAEDVRPAAVFSVLDRWFPGMIDHEGDRSWSERLNVAGNKIGESLSAWSP
jgi:L-asparaginase II